MLNVNVIFGYVEEQKCKQEYFYKFYLNLEYVQKWFLNCGSDSVGFMFWYNYSIKRVKEGNFVCMINKGVKVF